MPLQLDVITPERRLAAFTGSPEELDEARTQLDRAGTRLQLAATSEVPR